MRGPVKHFDQGRTDVSRWRAMALLALVMVGTAILLAQNPTAPTGSAPGTVMQVGQQGTTPAQSQTQRGQSEKPWEHLRQGEPSAYSALASFIALIATIIIAVMTLGLSKTIRRSQIVQEHVKMVLEIDSELVRDPSLWVVHGEKYHPIAEPVESLSAKLEDFAVKAKETEKAAKSVLEAVKTQMATAQAATAEVSTGTGNGKYTLQELKQLALVARYFNMFDYVHASLVERRNRPARRFGIFRKDKRLEEEWNAWQSYMTDFFDKNTFAVNAWNQFNKSGIYAESFKKFIDTVIRKSPQTTNQPASPKAS